MLGRFSNVLQQAADVLAPPPPLFEDFVYYWKKLMNHYTDASKSKPVIELTSIPNHLDHLLQILLKEEEDFDGIGPCLEYLLQHNLLDLLATLASSDDPPGMKQHVLQFTTKLLNQSKNIVVGHLSIYYAVQRLVGLCDGSTPTASESYEVQFLLSVAGILRRNHSLVSVFVTSSSTECSSATTTPGRRLSWSSSSGCSDGSSTATTTAPPRNALFTTPLVPSARAVGVTLVPSASSTATPVPQPSRGVASLQEQEQPQFPLADAVLSYIDSPDLSVRLKSCQALMLLVSLPPEARTAQLVEGELSLRLVSRLVLLFYTVPHTTEPTHVDDMHLSWGLDIPCNECSTCNGCRQAAIFLSWFDFCDQVIVEGDSSIGESLANRISDSFLDQVFTALTLQKPITLTILTKCFKMASSAALNNVLYGWLLSESIQKVLLENWLSTDTDLVIETLRFYELILEKGRDYVLEPLVLNFLRDRSYLNIFSLSSEGIDNTKNDDETSILDVCDAIQRWTSVLPKEVQSCTCGYEEYLGELMRQYQSVVTGKYPGSAPPPPAGDLAFHEGPFISALFNALSRIPTQPYEVNLELTGLVSRLALGYEPVLTEYLLTSAVRSPRPGSRSLYSVLTSVGGELASAVTSVPRLQERLTEVRAQLLGRSSSQDIRDDPWISSLESIVVVEELCKELAAISHVKLKTNCTK